MTTLATWTLVLTTVAGWGGPSSTMQPGFTTEQACKDAAHQFMDYREPQLWRSGGWYAKDGYRAPKCIEVR